MQQGEATQWSLAKFQDNKISSKNTFAHNLALSLKVERLFLTTISRITPRKSPRMKAV